MSHRSFTILLGLMTGLFVIFPDKVSKGAAQGLTLWFQTVLPALLPFMILSTFMIRQNVSVSFSYIVYPVFHKIFGLTREGCYPAVIGMLSGYPVGAKTTAQLYSQQKISREEAQYLLSFCNNASPMFILEYIGVACMGLSNPLFLLVVVYLSAWLNSCIFRRGKVFVPLSVGMTTDSERENTIVSLDESILDAFVTITKVGGYIILFSILAKIIEDIMPGSQLLKYIGIGILEITTGGDRIAALPVDSAVQNTILAVLCAFGGFSSVAQTASVLSGTDLSIAVYIISKISQAAITLLLAVVFLQFGKL